MRVRDFPILFAAGAALALAGGAQASELTLTGTAFDVVYNPATLGLFGTLSLSGNTLEFTPNNFIAVSTNGAGVQIPTGGAETASGIQLIANPGYQFSTLQLNEFGDYLLSGAGSSVSVSGELIAFDGDATGNPSATYTTGTITPNAGFPLTFNTGTSQNWAASASITNATAPVVAGGTAWLSGAGTVDVSIENLLSATTTADPSEALIEKKAVFGGVGITVTTASPVPLPASAWLFGTGLLGLAALRRRTGIRVL